VVAVRPILTMILVFAALSPASAGAAAGGDDARQVEIDEALAAGRHARARFLASVWLREAPADPARWVAVARATEDPREAEPLLAEALRLDPDHGGALVALGRVRAALGRPEEAVPLLERARSAEPDGDVARAAMIALADARRDPEPARQALAQHAGDADAALAVARWTADPAEAREALASVSAPDRRVLGARVEDGLRRGDREAAADALDALRAVAPDAETERLTRWHACVEAGTVTAGSLAALWDARRRAMASPGTEQHAELRALVDQAARCPAALALRAAAGGTSGVADLERAVALAPGDAGLAEALGRALLADDRPAEAVPLLERAAAERPSAPPIALARALVATGARERAQALLDEAAQVFPDGVELASLRADLAADRAVELAILVDAVAATHDPALLARARALAEALGDDDALDMALRPTPLLPLGDDVEEVVVVAKGSRARLEELTARMRDLGYRDPIVRRNGEVHFATQGVAQPAVTLRPDGTYDVQRAGMVPVKKYPWLADSPRVWLPVSERKLKHQRARVMEAIQPEVLAWRGAVCAEGLEDRLLHEVPASLEALWRDGVGRDGAAIEGPGDRRAALLDWWVTRTCTPEGAAVRAVIARYLEREVQTSPWPVTAGELAAVNARRPCDDALAFAAP
jgi:tetratricopeptide (TPR) repeat protein